MEVNEYNACVHEWADALFRFACKCTGQASDAHDVVQNTFEVLWQKRQDVEPVKAKAFLFQVAYNHSVNNYRKKAKVSYREIPEQTYTRIQKLEVLKPILNSPSEAPLGVWG